jgi:hypothetical protein
MRRSGSSSGLSSEIPMASTVALMIAATSLAQTKPDESKSLWPSATSKKYRGMGDLQGWQVVRNNNVPNMAPHLSAFGIRPLPSHSPHGGG